MADLVARDLMLRSCATITAEQTLADAMRALLAAQEDTSHPNAVAVADADGQFLGLLTARLLARSLLALWMPDTARREDPQVHERELLAVVQERLHLRVRDALIRGLPVAAPDARLLELIDIGCEKRLEFIPVVEAGAFQGVVPITAVFQAAAGLALTPDDEGIRFDQ